MANTQVRALNIGIAILASLIVNVSLVNAEPNEEKLSERIDFGNSYIMGQTIKSGAVYLSHRKKSKIESMLKVREDYRQEILEDFHLGEAVVIDQKAQ